MDNNKIVEEFIETIYPEGAELAKQFFHEDVVWKDAIKGINKLQAERDNLKEQVYNLEADKQHLLDNCEDLERNLKDACSERDRYKELVEWFLNLAMGCGKAGGKPESGEWENCIEQAKQALKETDDEGD